MVDKVSYRQVDENQTWRISLMLELLEILMEIKTLMASGQRKN